MPLAPLLPSSSSLLLTITSVELETDYVDDESSSPLLDEMFPLLMLLLMRMPMANR
jgi:hypothetical protein